MAKRRRHSSGEEKKSGKEKSGRLARFYLGALAGVLSLLIWYFKDCYDERKKAIPALKTAFVSMRAAVDESVQRSVAAVHARGVLVDYLKSDKVSVERTQIHLDQIVSEYQTAYVACNKADEATGTYMNALTDVIELFSLVKDEEVHTLEELSLGCFKLKETIADVRSVDAGKLVEDPLLRRRIIEDFEERRTRDAILEPMLKKAFESEHARIEMAIRGIEPDRFSLVQTCLDCTRRLFRLH